MISLFACPLCAGPLDREDQTYRCPNRHSFDLAKEGYVHLLPPNKMHSKTPGDDKAMAAARTRFLESGAYGPLREELCKLTLAHTGPAPVVLDVGCGEGWYTAGVHAALTAAGKKPQMAGVDLSKPSLRRAAKRLREAEFAVASVYHLPVAEASVDLVLNCFSPLALEEFRRVLRHGGTFLYVTPAADHLWELKQVLYDQPYKNREEQIPYEGFRYEGVIPVESRFQAQGEALMDLFRMTPYAWKTPKAGVERLERLSGLDITAAFRVHVFQKDGSL